MRGRWRHTRDFFFHEMDEIRSVFFRSHPVLCFIGLPKIVRTEIAWNPIVKIGLVVLLYSGIPDFTATYSLTLLSSSHPYCLL